MMIEIQGVDEYKLYLKSQLSKCTKDKKKVEALTNAMFTSFLDGIKFGQGKLKVEVKQ